MFKPCPIRERVAIVADSDAAGVADAPGVDVAVAESDATDAETIASADTDAASPTTSRDPSATSSRSGSVLLEGGRDVPLQVRWLEIEMDQRAVEETPGAESLEALIGRLPRDEEGRPTSVGSVGHVVGTCRPCAFLTSEQRPCQNGVRCLFCHFPHAPKRRVRLCRRKRLEMGAAVAAAVAAAGGGGIAPPPRYIPISWSLEAAARAAPLVDGLL